MINVNIIYQRLLPAGSSECVAGEWATGFDRAVLRTVRPPLDQTGAVRTSFDRAVSGTVRPPLSQTAVSGAVRASFDWAVSGLVGPPLNQS